MKRRPNTPITSLIFHSQGSVFLTLFFFIAGLSCGIFAELLMNSTQKLQMSDYLTQNLFSSDLSEASLSSVFFTSAANNLGLLWLIFLSGLTVIGFAAALITVVYKGMALGYTSALFLESMSGQGACAIIASILPQNMIFIPVFLVACVCALNFAASLFHMKKQGMKKGLTSHVGPYLSIYLILSAAVIAACLIESFISPALLQLVG